MANVKELGVSLVVVMTLASPVYGDATPAPGQATEAKVWFSELLFGAEVAVKPSVYNGTSEQTVHTETAVGGIEFQGATSSLQRSRLIEWSATARFKVGTGQPANTDRANALGAQLAGRVEVGVLPLGDRCGALYLSAGVGVEAKGTAMSRAGSDSHDSFSLSTPDGQAYAYARAGVGLACITDDLLFVVSPFVSRRTDTIAASTGTEFGGRAALWLAAQVSATLEAATMASSNPASSDRTTRASLSVRKALGARLRLGADASITRNSLDHTSDVAYRKRITPFAVTLVAALKF